MSIQRHPSPKSAAPTVGSKRGSLLESDLPSTQHDGSAQRAPNVYVSCLMTAGQLPINDTNAMVVLGPAATSSQGGTFVYCLAISLIKWQQCSNGLGGCADVRMEAPGLLFQSHL